MYNHFQSLSFSLSLFLSISFCPSRFFFLPLSLLPLESSLMRIFLHYLLSYWSHRSTSLQCTIHWEHCFTYSMTWRPVHIHRHTHTCILETETSQEEWEWEIVFQRLSMQQTNVSSLQLSSPSTCTSLSTPLEVRINLQEGVKLAKDICHGMRQIHSIEPIVNRFHLNPHNIVVSWYSTLYYYKQ